MRVQLVSVKNDAYLFIVHRVRGEWVLIYTLFHRSRVRLERSASNSRPQTDSRDDLAGHVAGRLNASQINHVDVAAAMKAADVRADVRGLLGAIEAVGALEPRRLPALVFEVLLQVVLPAEDAAARRAGKLGCALLRVQLRRVLAEGVQPAEGKDLVCKQKRGVQDATYGPRRLCKTRLSLYYKQPTVPNKPERVTKRC